MKAMVLGSGGWGTALALLLCDNGHAVTLWSHDPKKAETMCAARENPLLPGVSLPETKEELAAALRDTLRYGSHVLVEKKIRGRELSVGVLGDRYLPAVEIIPKSAYFDYYAKYQTGGSEEICPARITPEQQREMGEYALRLHRALGLSVYSRTDFLLDDEGHPWCLETNTLPGMTPASLLPKEAAAVGIPYEELCEEIVRLSLAVRRT